MILRVYYKEEFDLLDLNKFHASKDHFTFTIKGGQTMTSAELGNWIKVDVIDGKNVIYERMNKPQPAEIPVQEVI